MGKVLNMCTPCGNPGIVTFIRKEGCILGEVHISTSISLGLHLMRRVLYPHLKGCTLNWKIERSVGEGPPSMEMGVVCLRRVYPHLNECFLYREGVFPSECVTIVYFFSTDSVQLFRFSHE